MVHRCCISSCGMSVRVLEAKGLSYHKFPTKEPVRDQWVQAVIPHMDKPELFKVVPRYTRVCSRHFRKKDYCMDAKKRARLNSNAVPSVFPRKNTPLVIPTILPVSPKVSTAKVHSLPDIGPLNVIASSSVASTASTETTSCSSTVFTPPDVKPSCEIIPTPIEEILARRELVIESATIQDDHLVLTVMDPASQGDLESVSISNSDDQSQASASNKVDEQVGTIKRRKRRKWNRTAFARPAKGKRKSLPSKPESSLESVGDSLSDISLSKSMAASSQVDSTGTTDVMERQQPASSVEQQQNAEQNESAALKNVTLLLSDLSNQSYQVASVEQELLQSIQTFSLACGGDPEDVEQNELQSNSGSVSYSLNNLVPAFLHHHSSEESLFSNEESQSVRNLLEGPISHEQQQQQQQQQTLANTEDESLRFELVDLRIDPDMPSVPPPTYLDIDELAHQLNSSLFTDGKIPLFNIENLNLSTDSSSELSITNELLSTNDNARKKGELVKPSTSTAAPQVEKKSGTTKKSSSQRMKNKKAEPKPVKEKKLKGVTKRPKKDKATGKFSVERFKHSDKDIEYYTGFNSYRNFEAFFRSLEAYIERICITDVTYGVNNLPSTSDKSSCASTSTAALESGLNQPTPPEQPKKRPCQGRAMSRINELFITIIRLRRKLPEKVLGHMFCISQPTVSRVVRAWTVLLSKIIDSYPVERSVTSTTAYDEHSYTSKGLGIPDAFRDLFYSDLAKSIVVTSLSPKKVKPRSKASSSNKQSHNVKKSKIEKPTCSKTIIQPPSDDIHHTIDLNATPTDPANPLLTDFFLDSDPENPVPIEHLHLFDYI